MTEAEMTGADLPLAGIRVLDLTQALAGPFAAMILGDLGAEVIKVESAAGDVTRTTPPHYVDGTSVYFLSNNRNKQSVVLDLKSEAGREALYGLAKVSDVALYNFSAGVVERLKIDPATLQALNPRLITCNMTGYGAAGPQAGRRAVDLIVQSLSGAMSFTGEPGGRPVRAGVPTADLSSGMFATIGVLAALQKRAATGRGSQVETSLFHAQLALMNYIGSYTRFSGVNPTPVGSGHPGTVPSQVFEASDGWITIDAGFNNHFEALCGLLGLPELPADPRYKDRPSRAANRETLLPVLQEKLRARSRAEWLAALSPLGIPAGPVASVSEALADPQALEYGSVGTVDYHGKPIEVLTTPVWFDGRRHHPMASPPDLGEHTASVLSRLLGYGEAELSALRPAAKE